MWLVLHWRETELRMHVFYAMHKISECHIIIIWNLSLTFLKMSIYPLWWYYHSLSFLYWWLCGLGIETVHSGGNSFLLMMSWELPEKTALTKSGSIIEISLLACLTPVNNDMNNCRFIGHHLSKERILKSLQMVTWYITSFMTTLRSLDSGNGSLLADFSFPSSSSQLTDKET